MKQTIKKYFGRTLASLAVVGILASPQIADRITHGPYEVVRVGEGLDRKVVHEYENRRIVTGWLHPFGTVLIDEDKNRVLDKVWYQGSPRTSIRIKFDPTSNEFKARQAEYTNLLTSKQLSHGNQR